MWVADMDFRTAPCITEAFVKRARHGIYGYTLITDEWYEAYMSWWKDRHGFAIERDWLVFCTGVVPAISSIVRKLTTVGGNVVVMTPVYNIFFNFRLLCFCSAILIIQLERYGTEAHCRR